MEFKYRYRNREFLECGWYLAIKGLRRFWFIPTLAAVVLSAIGLRISLEPESRILWIVVQIISKFLICFGGFGAAIFLAAFFLARERFRGRDMKIEIRDGVLTVFAGKACSKSSCGDIVCARKKGGPVWIELERKGMENSTMMLPSAVFASKEEQLEFLEFLERQRKYAQQLDKAEWWDSQEHSGNKTAAFVISVLWDEEMIEEVRLREEQIRNMKEFSGARNRSGVFVLGILWVLLLLTEVLRGDVQLFRMFVFGIVMVVFYGIAYGGTNKLGKKGKARIKKQKNPKEPILSEILIQEQGICLREEKIEVTVSWEEVGYLLELDRWFLIYSTKKWALLHFPKDALGEEKEQRQFVEYCGSKGMEYRLLEDNGAEKKHRLLAPFLFVTVLALGALILGAIVNSLPDLDVHTEETVPYVFHPEDFEDYIPIEKQVSVLKSLDIRIPQSLVEEEQTWMEEHPQAHEWVEARPYYMLLSDLGFPEYDEETYEITSYSSQAYTLYWDEAYDLTASYTELLNGVNALSCGEFTLTSPAVLTEGMDETDWTGTVQIYFLLNGTPYLYDLEVDSDWLDTSVLRCLNDALGKEKIPGRIYAMDDEGWSCVLFYRNREWASEFARKTGIRLVMEYADN